MTVLLTPGALAARASVVAGEPALGALARSLRDDLAPLLARGAPWIPPDKARLTRAGGRCPVHGALLDFDPWQPRAHRCPVCGTVYDEEEHYRWWVMNYQLWLAERAVHAAALGAVTGDRACEALAAAILRGCTEGYARWPNRDNVLGPTRPFFSTYLESIWLLQLAVALDLLEARGGRGALGDEVRTRLVAPSAALIASYDEGWSNRQVYHNAALAAAGALLGNEALVARALLGPSGLAAHATGALLADGTWYEGENYHLFAHRGLWYGVTIAESLGFALPPEAQRRVGEGFAAPFATALPDFTVPARRDAPYRVSLRQWRVAESCELGLARGDDPRLVEALAALYDPAIPAGDSGRACSTAEAERNRPPVRLDRSSLGWKGLLFARATLPTLAGRRPRSVHLAGQGIAVFRRDAGRTFVALDYGESGGGHGHPDRLNLWLVVGAARVLEDVGTGSYVDPTLHWYRSTLAHNAPLVDGQSQARVAGTLDCFAEGAEAGIVSARAAIAPGVEVTRTVVTMDGYLVDEVRWRADRVVTVDLPWHVDLAPAPPATGDGAEGWRPARLAGGQGAEDGFPFVSESSLATGGMASPVTATVDGVPVRAWFACEAPHEWWRCRAPGPPGEGPRRFVLLRARARDGVIRSVWSWSPAVASVRFAAGEIEVARRDAAGGPDRHLRDDRGWRVRRPGAPTEAEVAWSLAGGGNVGAARERAPSAGPGATAATGGSPPSFPPEPRVVVLTPLSTVPGEPGALAEGEGESGAEAGRDVLRCTLGREHYRRSEESWEEAGAPTAGVALAATASDVVIDVSVHKASPTFAPPRNTNPLDNEHPDTNSDGLQLYVGPAAGGGWRQAWLLVPETPTRAEAPVAAAAPAGAQAPAAARAPAGADEAVGAMLAVRVTPRAADGDPLPIAAHARLTPTGWALRAVLPRAQLGTGFTLDLVINEITPGRERRRGQLVLGGARHEWVYLRGDRQDPARALHIQLADG